MPVRSRQGDLGIQHCRVLFPTDRPALALYHPGCTPLGPVPAPAQTGCKPEVSCSARLIPAPKQHPPSGHSRPAHPPRALVLSPDQREPSCPCGRIAPPRLLFHNTLTAAKATRSSYNHSSAVVFPRGVHSTVVASPSSPPTTVRHAPPDVGPSARHHCFRRIPPPSPPRGSRRKEGITHSPGHIQPSFGLDPIRTGNHQRRGMPRFDAEPPSESVCCQGIQGHAQHRT